MTQQFHIKEDFSPSLSPAHPGFLFPCIYGIKKNSSVIHFTRRAAANSLQVACQLQLRAFPWAVLSFKETGRTKKSWQLATLQANISPALLNEVDILSQTCALGKGKEEKEREEDELAKDWHESRGLSMPPKPLKGFHFTRPNAEEE